MLSSLRIRLRSRTQERQTETTAEVKPAPERLAAVDDLDGAHGLTMFLDGPHRAYRPRHNESRDRRAAPLRRLYGADRVMLSVITKLLNAMTCRCGSPPMSYEPRIQPGAGLQTASRAEPVALPVLRRACTNRRDLSKVAARTAALVRRLQGNASRQRVREHLGAGAGDSVASALGITSTLHIHETWGPFETPCAHTDVHPPTPFDRGCGDPPRSPGNTAASSGDPAPHGDRGRYGPRAQARRIRARLVPEGVPVVLYAGRWTPGKGLAELLEAMRATPVHLLLLGGPPPSGRTVDIKAAVAASGVGDRVHVVGEVPDVWPYIYASDAVAVPSIPCRELPHHRLEALAAGRPVLASDIGGTAGDRDPGARLACSRGHQTVGAWSSCPCNREPICNNDRVVLTGGPTRLPPWW